MAATGKVYIFNTTNQDIKVELNDEDLDERLAPNAGTGSYAPTLAIVMRSDASTTTDAVFAGSNTMEIRFAGTRQQYANIKIDPGAYPTNTDLVLYIFYSYLVLASTVNNTLIFSATPSS
ncbi:MAG: hypothetical protein QOJ76_3488 [Acidobacteriota bacterium]|jgi:hypothetical protein|nr:hypothetical protein [Acidobacteriota bacterium]